MYFFRLRLRRQRKYATRRIRDIFQLREMMEILTEQQIIERLEQKRPFTARCENSGFELSIRRYHSMVVTAIHDGHQVGEDLAEKMNVSGAQRQFEEDPYTADIGETFDISIKVLDSRYCCDLNRRPAQCIYEEAWGQRVWKTPLDRVEKHALRERHAAYYRVLDCLLRVLVEEFGSIVLYDLHSYNFGRLEGRPPLFNIGTHFIDSSRFGSVVDHLVQSLVAVELPGCENRAAVDEVFQGKGYQAEFIRHHHPDVLCVPLEIKKVFMDENGLELNEMIFEPLREQMIDALQQNYAFFKHKTGQPNGEK